MPVRVRGQVFSEEIDEERWKGDGAGGLDGLGWAEYEAAAGFVQRPDVRVDHQRRVVEVEVAALQPGEFTPRCPGPRRGHHQHCRRWPSTWKLGGVVCHSERLLWSGPDPFHAAGSAVTAAAA
ncbi:hypothetical protein [Pseudonocardia sp. TRM90224]|uniref:hypothetical protein n=1 Tax=Pseudonocardia sp. TRM90224 TaxID=2812678 RepID=UPI001E4A4791|nr:hypothetical protein [Pseudonocardia sp. TRM90224]